MFRYSRVQGNTKATGRGREGDSEFWGTSPAARLLNGTLAAPAKMN